VKKDNEPVDVSIYEAIKRLTLKVLEDWIVFKSSRGIDYL
jgi:hypothetical protein